ncbi:hypothetical protein ACQ4PT_052314 [Festuca glaucescens]
MKTPTDLTQELPEDLLMAVLRRLPPRGLAAARCVCKAWHALVDALRLLDPFRSSLAGFFINYHELDFSEFFFRPPRDGAAAVSGKIHYVTPAEHDDTIVLHHCNGLLLFWSYVVNPATRCWAPLPLLPSEMGVGPSDMNVDPRYIVFDPPISPHYEVLIIPPPPRHEMQQLEWPPSPFVMHVFSSATGSWEDRSFARQGAAIGTVGYLRELAKPLFSTMRDYSAYWHGQLYVLDQFVMRISLSNCTYQAFQPPVHVGTRDQELCLGKSENGVYFASFDHRCRLRIWILNELHGEIEWVLRHDNNLDDMLPRGMYDEEFQGPWIMEDVNYNFYHSTSLTDMEEAKEKDAFEWNSDNENTLDSKLRVRNHCNGSIEILGFHPYKEVVFLNESVDRGLAYHLNNSKIEDLGSIYPKHYIHLASEARQARLVGTMESTTDLTQWLPEDVFVAVLRRLAPHGLAAARCVGKAWRTVIDARRLLDLFPPSLAGIFINFFDLEISEFFFWPPRDTDTAVSGRLDYVAPTENDDTCIMDHCNGLLLFCTYVANPATRRWAPLPPPPPGFGHDHIVFDPAISPHYEVLDILALPCCTTGVELHHEWPPSPFIMHVFFSTTGNWEERPFARQGDAIGTVAHLKQRVNWCTTQKHPAYWRGQLYVLNQFVMRISLSNCTYQAIEPPVNVARRDRKYCLGRSENGVYFASIDQHRHLRV